MYPWIRDAAAAAAAAVGFTSPHHHPFHHHQQMVNSQHSQPPAQHLISNMNGNKGENGYHHHHNQSMNDCMMALDYVHTKVSESSLSPFLLSSSASFSQCNNNRTGAGAEFSLVSHAVCCARPQTGNEKETFPVQIAFSKRKTFPPSPNLRSWTLL